MPISPDEFRAALSRFASGVTVVTTRDSSGELYGITVSAFSSVSLDPPLVTVIVDNNAGSHHAFEESGVFAVNILSGEQASVSDHFAFKHEDKFTGIDLMMDEHDLPWLEGCIVNMTCRLRESFVSGDHTIFVGEIEAVRTAEADPLVYFRGAYHSLDSGLEHNH